jgi:ubiquinone/menaquinone biosynthesis C-methylase UbiE
MLADFYIKPMRWSVTYNPNNQEVIFEGVIRPQSEQYASSIKRTILESTEHVSGTLYINLKKLKNINAIGLKTLADALQWIAEHRADLRVKMITTSVAAWSTREISVFERISPNFTVEQYDESFYPGQSFLEGDAFIHVLRTQTKMTWHHEKHLLRKHGAKEKMCVADVCCGLGDFAILFYKEFKPTRFVAIDHARSALDYARAVMKEFKIRDIEYQYGEASALLLDDDQFDFVTCRHSLQVFNKPDLILKELYRICKPGGVVYVTNEKNSHCFGEPRSDTIAWTYQEVARLWKNFDMDIEFGPKSYKYMLEAGFTDVNIEQFTVTNLEGNPQEFADIVQSWEDCYAGKMAVERGDPPAWIERFRAGFQDHIATILHPRGYAGWPIWVASGRKPSTKV